MREAIRTSALELGFTSVGFAPAEAPAHGTEYLAWLDSGHHADMHWMARPDAISRRLDPGAALPGCRTIVVTTLSYAPVPDESHVARYALGRDYHAWFEERLDALGDVIRSHDPTAEVKRYVDYGPVLERDHAQRAGLGWIGKNTMLIDPVYGSWLLLGELLTTLDIEPDAAFEADRCGTCRRCIDACPTDAILEHRSVDARRCISYLTIELKGSIPLELREAMGTRVFGCDICQEVCPWNRDPDPGEPGFLREGRPVPYDDLRTWAERLLGMSADEYRTAYAETPLARPGRDAMLRNLCVGLGNTGSAGAIDVLQRCCGDASELVREHASWALERLDGPTNHDGSDS